jgi:aminopeptidase-like protein
MTTDAELYALAEKLFPLKRTVMGPAVLDTLGILGNWMSQTLSHYRVLVGTRVFDWVVVPEAENRRHYHPSLSEVPAYDGPLTYAECVIPGEDSREVLLSTYTCHPQLANDNVSGMVVTAALAKWLREQPRRYTYRVLFAPETIGALCWLWRSVTTGETSSLIHRSIIAGYTINCCGDERAWSFIPSRKGNTLADRAARHVLNMTPPKRRRDATGWHQGWTEYTFADRGSDERQFCAPGVDLPIASVMRSKHGTYPEYHTPQDDLSVISAKGLGESFRCYQRIIEAIELNRTYHVATVGEPMLNKYGFYNGNRGPTDADRIARDVCAYSDGETSLLTIADLTARPIWDVAPVAKQLSDTGVIRET